MYSKSDRICNVSFVVRIPMMEEYRIYDLGRAIVHVHHVPTECVRNVQDTRVN